MTKGLKRGHVTKACSSISGENVESRDSINGATASGSANYSKNKRKFFDRPQRHRCATAAMNLDGGKGEIFMK